MERARALGVLHGSSVHKVLCRECAAEYETRRVGTCPMCREPIERFVDLFG